MTYTFVLARRLLNKGLVIGTFIETETGHIVPVKGNVAQAAYPDKLKARSIEIIQGVKKIEFLDKWNLWQDPYTGEITPRTDPRKKPTTVEIPVMQFPAPKPGDPCPTCGGSGIQSMAVKNRTGKITKKSQCPDCDGCGKIKGDE
jgi:hypothetical protein